MASPRNRRAKFVELANNRVNKAIKTIRLIGNLSNRSAYEYAADDVRKIVKVLEKEVEQVKARFATPGLAGETEFSIE